MAEAIAGLLTDTEAPLVQTSYVVVYSPHRNRKRFPESCICVHASEAAARAAAKPDLGYHAAVASGPSRSSEGLRLFYLVRWLE